MKNGEKMIEILLVTISVITLIYFSLYTKTVKYYLYLLVLQLVLQIPFVQSLPLELNYPMCQN